MKESIISLFVTPCSEFPAEGRVVFSPKMSFEAIYRFYQKQNKNGIPGIGFVVISDAEDSFYNGAECIIFSGGRVRTDGIRRWEDCPVVSEALVFLRKKEADDHEIR